MNQEVMFWNWIPRDVSSFVSLPGGFGRYLCSPVTRKELKGAILDHLPETTAFFLGERATTAPDPTPFAARRHCVERDTGGGSLVSTPTGRVAAVDGLATVAHRRGTHRGARGRGGE